MDRRCPSSRLSRTLFGAQTTFANRDGAEVCACQANVAGTAPPGLETGIESRPSNRVEPRYLLSCAVPSASYLSGRHEATSPAAMRRRGPAIGQRLQSVPQRRRLSCPRHGISTPRGICRQVAHARGPAPSQSTPSRNFQFPRYLFVDISLSAGGSVLATESEKGRTFVWGAGNPGQSVCRCRAVRRWNRSSSPARRSAS